MTIVILGAGISRKGEIPPQSVDRLKKGLELAREYQNSNILVSGKYSFMYPKDIAPIKTEAQAMKEWLMENGVNESRIFKEEESQDTISNAYYTKTLYFIPKEEKEGIVVTSSYHVDRVRYIFEKMYGPEYKLSFIEVEPLFMSEEEKEKVNKRQKEVLEITKDILKDMKPGDHEFMKGKFYNIPYYTEQRPQWIIDFITGNKEN